MDEFNHDVLCNISIDVANTVEKFHLLNIHVRIIGGNKVKTHAGVKS